MFLEEHRDDQDRDKLIRDALGPAGICSSSSVAALIIEFDSVALTVKQFGTFSVTWASMQTARHLRSLNPLSLSEYAARLGLGACPPFMTPPSELLLPIALHAKNWFFPIPQPSLLPMLMAHAGFSRAHPLPRLSEFDIVTQRNNLNKIALRLERWEMGVRRLGNTLFLLRCVDRRSANAGDIGHLFEEAITTGQRQDYIANPVCAETCVLSEIHLGRYRVLISAEIDGAEQQASTHASTTAGGGDERKLPTPLRLWEIKTEKQNKKSPTPWNKWWLQAALGGVEMLALGSYRIISSSKRHGARGRGIRSQAGGNESVEVEEVRTFKTETLVAESTKQRLLTRLIVALDFLRENVKEGEVMMFVRMPAVKGKTHLQLRPVGNRQTRGVDFFVSDELITECETWAASRKT